MKAALLILFIFLGVQGFAQKTGAFGEKIVTEEQKIEQELNKATGNKTKPGNSNEKAAGNSSNIPGKTTMKALNSSYLIRIMIVPNPIDITHPIFKQLKGISYKEVPEVGYVYMSSAFPSLLEAQKALKTLLPDYPAAKIITDKENPHIDLK